MTTLDTHSSLPDDFVIRGPIGDIDWTQFANCKGKTHLFFAPKAERPQARRANAPACPPVFAALPRRPRPADTPTPPGRQRSQMSA